MCRSVAQGGRRCAGHSVAQQSAARAGRRRRARARAAAIERMGTVVDAVVEERFDGDAAERAWIRHERWLRSLDRSGAVGELRFRRLQAAPLHDPSRAWVAEALRAGVASGDLDQDAVRRAFEDEQPDDLSRIQMSVVLDAVTGTDNQWSVAA